MGRKALFTRDQFVNAALKLLSERGVAGVTMNAVAGEIGAPIGSVYHRFVSRDVLLAELWLRIIESFQKGFLDKLKQNDGLEAALYTLRWVRKHPKEGRILLLHRRDEITSGIWPDELRERALQLVRELDEGVYAFTRRVLGRVSKKNLSRVTFVLMDVPYGAVRRYLEEGKVPPDIVDKLIRHTYHSIMGEGYEDI